MAASHHQVAPHVSRIEAIVAQQDLMLPHQEAEVLEVTNKRVIIFCGTRESSRNLALRINDEGYALEVRKGLKDPDNYYMQVFL